MRRILSRGISFVGTVLVGAMMVMTSGRFEQA
jgi:hypothetical protein